MNIHMKKIETGPSFHTLCKVNSKWVKYLNSDIELNLLQGNIDGNSLARDLKIICLIELKREENKGKHRQMEQYQNKKHWRAKETLEWRYSLQRRNISNSFIAVEYLRSAFWRDKKKCKCIFIIKCFMFF